MQRRQIARVWIAFTLVVVALVWNTALGGAAEGRLDTSIIERLTGTKGELNEKECVFTFALGVREPQTVAERV